MDQCQTGHVFLKCGGKTLDCLTLSLIVSFSIDKYNGRPPYHTTLHTTKEALKVSIKNSKTDIYYIIVVATTS